MSEPSAPATIADSTVPAGIQSRVDAAAFALLREGRNPTVALVRERMGGGSPNTVAPALQRWRFTFAAQLDQNAGSALEVIPPGVLEIVQALWSRALFEAHRVRDESRSAADALEQLNMLVVELRERAARLQRREEALDQERLEFNRQRAATTRVQKRPRSVPKKPPSEGKRPASAATSSATTARRVSAKTRTVRAPGKRTRNQRVASQR